MQTTKSTVAQTEAYRRLVLGLTQRVMPCLKHTGTSEPSVPPTTAEPAPAAALRNEQQQAIDVSNADSVAAAHASAHPAERSPAAAAPSQSHARSLWAVHSLDALLTPAVKQVLPHLRARQLEDGFIVMTPAQELANAFTMLLPLAYALDTAIQPGPTGAHVVAAAVIVHFPFSFFYHLSCALHPDRHPVLNNMWCKLDLMFIHVAGACMSLGTSGSLLWLGVNLAFNLACAWRIWRWCNGKLERRVCRLLCAAGYLAPIGLHSAHLLDDALLYFLLVALPFVFNTGLKGWGHALSHVCLAPFAFCVITAGAALPVPHAEPAAWFVQGVSHLAAMATPRGWAH